MTKLPLTPTLTGSTHPNQPDPPPVRPPSISHPQAGADAQPPPVRRHVRARGRRAASTRPPSVPYRPSSTASGCHREPRRACTMTGEGGPPLEAGAGGCPGAVSGVARWCRRPRPAQRSPPPRVALRVEDAAANASCPAHGGGGRRPSRLQRARKRVAGAWICRRVPRLCLSLHSEPGLPCRRSDLQCIKLIL